jgi:hypothetical protein
MSYTAYKAAKYVVSITAWKSMGNWRNNSVLDVCGREGNNFLYHKSYVSTVSKQRINEGRRGSPNNTFIPYHFSRI